jgi:hypothetical protein
MTKNSLIKKTETLTFRIDSEIVEKLRQEANQKDVTINTLLNQIMKQHIDWHSIAHKAGFIAVRSTLVRRLFDEIGDEQKIKLIAADLAKCSNKDSLLVLRDRYDVTAALKFIESWIKVSGFPYKHDIIIDSNVHRFMIHHNMGRKWSLYLSELYRNLFQDLNVTEIHVDITDNTLAFAVKIWKKGSIIISSSPNRKKGGRILVVVSLTETINNSLAAVREEEEEQQQELEEQ